MYISWLGGASIRLTTQPLSEDIVIIMDPCDPKTVGLKRGKVTADAVTISAPHHPLHNAQDEIRGRGEQSAPFLFATPGECELKGAMLYGVPAYNNKKGNATPCTLFLIESEGINLLHLGFLGQKKLTDAQLEHFEHVDVLFVPAGDPESLTPGEAAEIVGQIEPRIVIPISFQAGKGKGVFQSAEKFIKEVGLEAEAPVTKLKLTKKDLPVEETRLIMLSPE